ncbi:uncharacterized protein L969DRAFT_95922 [Mixia osmundae IAM 14324]|uniref:Uncharacterized protein n=1 Tax=Mixia osmundae (strain CBS 9802 / IAM 14324 / JCM 22182 / KY 12970) TaxID=764103 RepID=G7DX11_MIXOS|nr:uncharacterized protein L969DRAFT_95922 [Mixia osmundae IAM 14324]KEI38083.1 hypothetical protein L969DRAFT_95922 [Mixia osmundae IAM 14324]GAA95108.1 hypothetical protein E5Q_01763 [Mixia osmundae IAM 14324]
MVSTRRRSYSSEDSDEGDANQTAEIREVMGLPRQTRADPSVIRQFWARWTAWLYFYTFAKPGETLAHSLSLGAFRGWLALSESWDEETGQGQCELGHLAIAPVGQGGILAGEEAIECQLHAYLQIGKRYYLMHQDGTQRNFTVYFRQNPTGSCSFCETLSCVKVIS